MPTPLYELTNITRRYGNRTVLAIDRRSIAPASITGLIGPNGGGKSTLLNLLAFTEPPTTGEILFEGQPVPAFASAVRRHVALLPQEPYLLMRSVEGNVAVGLKLRGDHRHLRQRVAEALSWVGLEPGKFARRRWFELSGGEARRVALAARLVLRPKALLLDEPTSNVDAESARLIREAARMARDQWNTTVLLSSHDHEWIDLSCDQVWQLFRGRVLERGKTNLIYGPWRPADDGRFWQRVLEDGQRLLAAAPRGESPDDPVALIGSDQLVLSNGGPPPADSCKLEGRVTRLALDSPSGNVAVSVQIGQLTLSLLLTNKAYGLQRWQPGSHLQVSYRPQQFIWL